MALFGLLGGDDGADPTDIYGDLFTDKQKAALRKKELSQGLFRMSEALAKAAQPSPYKPSIGSMAGTIGGALGAFGAGGDETMNKQLQAMQVAEKVRQSKQQRELAAKVIPFFWSVAGNVVQGTSAGPPTPGAVPLGPAPSAAPAPSANPPPGPPPPPAPVSMGLPAPGMSAFGLPDAPGGAVAPPPPPASYLGPTNAELGAPPLPAAPGGGPGGPITRPEETGGGLAYQPGGRNWKPPVPVIGNTPLKQSGLLPEQDQVVGPDGQPLTGPGVLPGMLASYMGTGGTPGGPLPFQLASSTPTEGAPPPGGGGRDTPGGKGGYTVPMLRELARSAGFEGRDADIAAATWMGESSGNPWAKNVTNKEASYGLAQINARAHPGGEQAYGNPEYSARKAFELYQADKARGGSGFRDWTIYNNGAYKQYMGDGGGQDTVIPSGRGTQASALRRVSDTGTAGGGDMQALQALMQLTGGGGEAEEDPLAILADMTSARGGPDTVLPSAGGGQGLPIRQANAALAPLAIDNAVLGGKSSVAGVGDELSNRILKMHAAMPPALREKLRIISGERTPQRQIDVYKGSGTPPPMNSRHISGDAVDLRRNPDVLNWIKTNGPGFGVGFPLEATMGPKEANHLEMVDASGNRLSPQDTVIPSGRGIPRSALTDVADTGAAPGGGAASGGGGGVIPGLNMTPQQLGAFNALFEMSGLGDPFKSMLDTYYKSPSYLGSVKRQSEEIETEFAGKKAEAAAAATQKYIQENATHASQLQLANDLIGKGVYLDPVTKTMKPITNAAEALGEINRVQEKNKADLQLVDTTLTFPGESQPRKVQMTGAQARAIAEGREVQVGGVTIPAMTGIKLGTPVERPEELKQQEIDMKFLEEKRVQAESSRRAIMAANDTRQLIERGVVAGSYADERTRLLKLGQLLNLTGRDDNERIKNTEAYIANLGRNMKEGLKGLGPPVSNVDIGIAEKISGGQNLTTQGMLELLKMEEKYHRLALQDYDKLYKSAPKSRYDKSVKEPPTFGAPMADGPNGPIWYNGKEWVPM